MLFAWEFFLMASYRTFSFVDPIRVRAVGLPLAPFLFRWIHHSSQKQNTPKSIIPNEENERIICLEYSAFWYCPYLGFISRFRQYSSRGYEGRAA